MMSQVVQRARPLKMRTRHWVFGWLCTPYSQLESGSLLDCVLKILNTKARYIRALAPPPNFEFTQKNQDGGR